MSASSRSAAPQSASPTSGAPPNLPIAACELCVRESAALHQSAVDALQLIVRSEGIEVVLQVIVHVVLCEEEARERRGLRRARLLQRIVRIGDRRVLGDAAQAKQEMKS